MKKRLNDADDRKRMNNLEDAQKLATVPGFKLNDQQVGLVIDRYIEFDERVSSADPLVRQRLRQALEVLRIVMAEKAR